VVRVPARVGAQTPGVPKGCLMVSRHADACRRDRQDAESAASISKLLSVVQRAMSLEFEMILRQRL
jgi:hypothetical protein